MTLNLAHCLHRTPGSQGDESICAHLNTLAGLVCGIIGARSVQLPDVARKAPTTEGGYKDRRTSTESQIKRFYRWLKNEKVNHAIFFLPFAEQILRALSQTTLVLLIDGTVVGRGCMALVISVVYKQRALPIAWLVEKKKKGHFSEERHVELIQSVKEMIPEGRTSCSLEMENLMVSICRAL